MLLYKCLRLPRPLAWKNNNYSTNSQYRNQQSTTLFQQCYCNERIETLYDSAEGDRRSSEGRVDVGIIQLSNDDKEDDDKEDDDKEDWMNKRIKS